MKKALIFIIFLLAGFFLSAQTHHVMACDAGCAIIIPPDPPPHDPNTDPLPAIYQSKIPGAPVYYKVEDIVNDCIAHGCDAYTTSIVKELSIKYNIHGFRLLYADDGSIALECINTVWFIVKAPAACGEFCTSDKQCAPAKDGCNTCGAAGRCVPTQACGTKCATPADCQSAKDGCTACVSGSCKPAPKCGDNCAADPKSCLQNKEGCNTCGTNKDGSQTCQTPAQCGADCSDNPNICATAVNGCTQCVKAGNGTSTCRTPIACGTDCSGDKSICSQASGGCNFCIKGKCSVDTYTPAMCKCDGIEVEGGTVNAGQTLTFDGFAKVSTDDAEVAKIKDMTFSVFEGTTKLDSSDPIIPGVDSTSSTLTRYKGTWNYKFPLTVKPGVIYQVVVNTSCQRQPIAYINKEKLISNILVLGTSMKNLLAQTPSGSQNLQLQSFVPGEITEKACTYMSIKFAGQ